MRDSLIHDKGGMDDPVMVAFRLGQLSMAGEIMGYEATRRADDDVMNIARENLAILVDIGEGRGLRTEIAAQFDMLVSEVIRLLKRLEAKGLIVTVTTGQPFPNDWTARLTPLGLSVVESLSPRSAA
uniref:MarR family transcriptional regulator n=1 Tax=Caulobacter phage BL57 TaxID=3348355 RepID=A0AB74UMV9_9VIRU